MLWRLVIYSALFYASLAVGTGHAQAQPSPVEAVKAVIDYLEPTPEVGYFVRFKDLGDGNLSQAESFAGLSGSLWKITSNEIELGSLRLGGVFEGDRKLYTALGVNGIGLATRYLPESVKATLSPGFMGTVWDGLEKYGHLSVGVGLDSVQDLFADDYRVGDQVGVIGTVGIKVAF